MSTDSQSIGTIAYIYSNGHSGSTLLELLIGSHSRCINVGEVRNLRWYTSVERDDKELRNRCTCRKHIMECRFWQEVDKSLGCHFGTSLTKLEIEAERGPTFLSDNSVLFQSIFKVSGADVMVDSSKGYRRLWTLFGLKEFTVVPILVFADPRKVVFSWMEAIRRKHGHQSSILRQIRIVNKRAWTFLMVVCWARKVGVKPVVVSYEELVSKPGPTVARVMERLGHRFEPEQMDWTAVVHHGLGGNRMRHSSNSEIRVDRRWTLGLSPLHKLMIVVLCLPYIFSTRLVRLLGA